MATALIIFKVPNPIRWLLTFTAVSLLWLSFITDTPEQWFQVVCRIFSFDSLPVSESLAHLFALPETAVLGDILYVFGIRLTREVIWVVAWVLLGFAICLIPQNSFRRKDTLTMSGAVLAAIAFAYGVIHLAGETVFIYSGF